MSWRNGDQAIQSARTGGKKTVGTSTNNWCACSPPVAASQRWTAAWSTKNDAPACAADRAVGRLANQTRRDFGDDIGDADITDEMLVERPGVDSPGHHCVPVGRNYQHGQAVGRQP